MGYVPRPYQQPHPPIALSLLTPNSGSAKTAGERGWIPVSGQFFHRRYLRGHWEKYVEGCEAVGRRPDPDVWRVSRSMLVTETDAEAEDYLADPDNGLSFYYTFFHFSFSRGRKALFMLKPDLEMPDEDVTVDTSSAASIIAGSPRRVLDQLVALRDETGHFGTLLMGGHDWDQPALWRRSMELLAHRGDAEVLAPRGHEPTGLILPGHSRDRTWKLAAAAAVRYGARYMVGYPHERHTEDQGVLSPVVTPFKADLSPDAERFVRQCRWLLSQNVGLAVFGTNSEANSLSVEEKIELLDRLVGSGLDPARMMPGTGSARCRLRAADRARGEAGLRRRADAAALLLQGRERRRPVPELRRDHRAGGGLAAARVPLSHPAGGPGADHARPRRAAAEGLPAADRPA